MNDESFFWSLLHQIKNEIFRGGGGGGGEGGGGKRRRRKKEEEKKVDSLPTVFLELYPQLIAYPCLFF